MHSRHARNLHRVELGFAVPSTDSAISPFASCGVRPRIALLLLLGLLLGAASPARAQISFVQGSSNAPKNTTTIAATFKAAQIAGDMNIVAVGWDSGSISVAAVSDSSGNTYTLAAKYVNASLNISQSIYYAPNIKSAAANANTITVRMSASSGYPDLRITEYKGVSALDQVVSTESTSNPVSSGSVSTTQANELLFGADYTFGATNGAGSGYTQRVISSNSDNTEDEIVTKAGSYSATDAVTGGSGNYTVMQLATFYAGSGGVSAPTSLMANAISATQIKLTWTASSGAASYNVLRATTSGGPYKSIASVTTTGYTDTGLSASTTYYYVVQAVASNGVVSANSNQAPATTSASSCNTLPNAPTNLSQSGTTSTGTTISWTAVAAPTNCTITGYTVLQNGSSIGSSTSTTFPVSGLSPSTTYTFTVEATDGDGTSVASSPLSVTTSAATGATYYVNQSTGSDGNSGSASAPWATIGRAAGAVTAGDTVLVAAGTYHESVSITAKGTAQAPITFNGQNVAIVDGTGVACCTSPAFVANNPFVGGNTQGLFTIGSSDGVNYVTIEGFTIQNYRTSATNAPVGVMVVGGGTGINISGNVVQNIQTTNKTSGAAAYGIAVFGTSATPLSVQVSGNTVTGCITGQSETVTFNGNVQNFSATKNTVYNNDNIGIDAIGFENTGPTGSDQPINGDISQNTVYNNSGINNPAYSNGRSWGVDGLYCDGCTQVVFEQNLVYGNDIGIEAASETTSQNSSNVIIRNNLIYASDSAGISVGGYAQNTGSCSDGTNHCGMGGSKNITIVNNTLYSNSLGSTSSYGGSGEFQIQYQTSGIIFENNIVYAGTDGLLLNGSTTNEGVTLNHNDYYTTGSPTFVLNGATYSSFSAYIAPISSGGSGQDASSVFADPLFTTAPICSATGFQPSGGETPIVKAATCSSLGNTDLASGSPALNVGTKALGTPSGASWSAYEESQPYVGQYDYKGNPRVDPSTGLINIGAYEQ